MGGHYALPFLFFERPMVAPTWFVGHLRNVEDAVPYEIVRESRKIYLILFSRVSRRERRSFN